MGQHRAKALYRVVVVAGIFATSLIATAARGAVVYSTLDGAGGYNAFGGTDISGAGTVQGYQGFGNQFVPSMDGLLSSIEIAVNHTSAPGLVDVRVTPDGPGGGPSPISLTSGTVTTAAFFGSSGSAVATFVPSVAVPLTAGTSYWLTLTPHTAASYSIWNDNNIGATGDISATYNGTTWGVGPAQLQSAFRVNADPIPEPSGAAFVVGILVILNRRMKRTAVS